VVQAVPDLPGTEIILESTGNGIGGEFHERWQMAEAGIGATRLFLFRGSGRMSTPARWMLTLCSTTRRTSTPRRTG
jgi:hypothetical protein